MATPSGLFVTGISPTSNKLDWTNSAVDGTTYDIKRDVCGGTPVTIATTAADAETYTDETAEAGVCYDYDVCAHLTASCTGVQSVTTQICDDARSKNPESIAVPRAPGQTVGTREFNDLARIVDNQLNQENSNQSAVGICPVDGAIVIDCSKGTWFEVQATEDINSISMINCDTPPALIGNSGLLNTICFNIPPNTTRKICGFPENLCFDGDECQNSPIVTGDSGAQYCLKFKRTVIGPVIKVEDGMGDPRCIDLTLVCSPSSCEITCPNGVVLLTAAGGQPPYQWTTTAGILSADHGESVTLKASIEQQANCQQFSGVAAFQAAYKMNIFVPDPPVINFINTHRQTRLFGVYDIFDQFLGASWSFDGGAPPPPCGTNCVAESLNTACPQPDGMGSPCPNPAGELVVLDCGEAIDGLCGCCSDGTSTVVIGCNVNFADSLASGNQNPPANVLAAFPQNGPDPATKICDVRTGPQLNCTPCSIELDGAVVTVTDAAGTSVSVIIST